MPRPTNLVLFWRVPKLLAATFGHFHRLQVIRKLLGIGCLKTRVSLCLFFFLARKNGYASDWQPSVACVEKILTLKISKAQVRPSGVDSKV